MSSASSPAHSPCSHQRSEPGAATLVEDPVAHHQAPSMPRASRAARRNVHLFSFADREVEIGGLVLNNGVTHATLYSMVEIIIIAQSTFTLRDDEDTVIEKDSSPLRPGKYYIDSPEPFDINNDTPLVRTLSIDTGTRIQAFRDEVRSRDKARCVITGEVALDAEDDWWDGFEAAHIFPLAYERYWMDHNYGRWISQRGGAINSVQNGLLLRSDIHQSFDLYNVTINPDDNYKIVCFRRDGRGIAGKYLDQSLLQDPRRPADQLLRWHFRQAVLINMRGAGGPVFEHDFPPGSDMIGTILGGPSPAARMEFELFNRMAVDFELADLEQQE